MTSKAAVADFVAQRKLAVVGMSRKKAKFGNLAFKELKRKGYKLFPVHPHAEQLEGERCYPSLAALPEPVDGVLVIVPPAQAEQVVREAAAAPGFSKAPVHPQPSASARKTASAWCTANAS